jgi:hypothetical protein
MSIISHTDSVQDIVEQDFGQDVLGQDLPESFVSSYGFKLGDLVTDSNKAVTSSQWSHMLFISILL